MIDESSHGRTWGFWTQAKLAILRDYLRAFATASRRVSERIYLDAFAGLGSGTDRLTGESFEGSPRIALNIDDPPFTRVRLFELPRVAARLRATLAAEYPHRDIEVYGGDCSVTILRALEGLRDVRWAPTFAFLDPDGMEVAWRTLQALADHKRGYRVTASGKPEDKPEYKMEMWILFPTSGLLRILALERDLAGHEDARATPLFGAGVWRRIHELRRRGDIDGAIARAEYVNLMRWRLETVLGYRWTHPLAVKSLRGSPLYHMILATDNEAGTKIMSDLYAKAARDIPQMRREIHERLARGSQLQLMDPGGPELPRGLYSYEPPWEPPG